jgi:hypothetical protein
MKTILLAALIFLISCSKDHSTPITKSIGVVNYTIQDSAIKITDTTVGSKAIWIPPDNITKGYGLQAYNSIPGGEIHDMISIFIKTTHLKKGYNYSAEVTGSIFRNNQENVATQNLSETYIRIYISEQSNNQLSGTFTSHLKNLSTNKYFDASGDFKNVELLAE